MQLRIWEVLRVKVANNSGYILSKFQVHIFVRWGFIVFSLTFKFTSDESFIGRGNFNWSEVIFQNVSRE